LEKEEKKMDLSVVLNKKYLGHGINDERK